MRDHFEAASNVIIGALINYGLVLIFFGVTSQKAGWTTAAFIAVSYGRTIAIRKYFRSKENE
jgi:hypothetical protein